METMIGINQEIGYLAGHGSPGLMPDRMAMMQGQSQNTLNIFNQLISTRYSINSIDLKINEIPEGLKSFVIAGPVEKFSDYELFKIDQALMKGTNIAFFTDTIEEKMPQQQGAFGGGPQYKKLNTGIEKLLLHYGVKADQAYLLDKNCFEQTRPKEQGGGEQKIYFIPMIDQEDINNSVLYMHNIKGLATMRISPLEIVEKNIDKNKIKISKLFSSSDQAWLMKDNINLNPLMMMPPDSEKDMKSYPLAYMLEGEFTSFFKGKEIPTKEIEKENINEEDISEETASKLDGLSENKNIISEIVSNVDIKKFYRIEPTLNDIFLDLVQKEKPKKKS